MKNFSKRKDWVFVSQVIARIGLCVQQWIWWLQMKFCNAASFYYFFIALRGQSKAYLRNVILQIIMTNFLNVYKW